MGLIIFVIIIIAVFFLFIVLGLGGLLFGGEDPYEKELARMDYEDAVLDRLDDLRDRDSINIDARQIHFHFHESRDSDA